ncbi:MAG: Bug family tripartite tricarboxylate transporter substrate binding protein [Beijerinckiaceae bacterium]
MVVRSPIFLAGAAFVACAGFAQAQAPAEFYKGRSVNVLIGVGVGGFYDLNARVVARHIGRHIPGAPILVPQNMTGAGGARMAAYLVDVAPKDGANIGMIPNNFPAMQAIGSDAIKFDLSTFNWIGSPAPLTGAMTVWRTSGVTSIDDARSREVVAGASGRGAESFSMPAMMNEFLGTKFRIVTGYQGGNAINLAMERGEVQARYNFWSSWKSTRPDWVKNGDIRVIATMGPKPRDLPGVPSIIDLVKSDDDRRVVDVIISGTYLGTPLAFAGGVPADRVAAVRLAFDATMKDAEFLAEAQKLQIEVDPVSAAELEAVVTRVLKTPKALAARARPILE